MASPCPTTFDGVSRSRQLRSCPLVDNRLAELSSKLADVAVAKCTTKILRSMFSSSLPPLRVPRDGPYTLSPASFRQIYRCLAHCASGCSCSKSILTSTAATDSSVVDLISDSELSSVNDSETVHTVDCSSCAISFLPDCALRTLFDALSCPIASHDVQNTAAAALAGTCHRLDRFYREEYVTKLDLSGFQADPDECARALQRFPRVTMLDLWGCTKVATDLATALAPCRGRPPAARLRYIALPLTDVGDDDLIALVNACPELVALDVTGCDRVGDRSMLAIAHTLADTLTTLKMRSACITDLSGGEMSLLRNLSTLDLSDCCCLSDDTFYALAALNQMRELSLSFDAVTDFAMCNLLSHMSHLTTLTMSNCPLVTSVMLSALPSSLVKLDLVKTRIFDDDVALSVFSSLPKLVDFRTSRCKEFTQVALMAPVYKNLRVLRLTRMKGIGDTSTSLALTHMSMLELLDLNHCHKIGDKTLRAAANLHRLSHLDLSHTGVSGMALSWIVFGEARLTLRFFSVKSCPKMNVCDVMACTLRLAFTNKDALICY